MSEKLIINLVGYPGSGKSYHAGRLEQLGFELHRPSDAVRQYAAAHNVTLRCRQDYQECHKAMVAQDPDAMIRSVLESSAQRICLDGLRAPAAMRRLQELYPRQAFAIALDCPIEKRLAHVQADPARQGHRRHDELERFRSDELPDYHNNDPTMVSMDDMFTMADYTVDASRPLAVVSARIDSIIGALQTKVKV